MSVRFVNSASLLTDSNDVIGVNQDKASAAFFLRINGPLPSSGWAGGYFAARSGAVGFGVNVLSINTTDQTMLVRFFWQATNGTTINKSVTLKPDFVYPIAMTYDKDDADSQALYVTGVKYKMTPAQSLPLNDASTALNLGQLSGGTVHRDFNLEKWMWWNGYVLSFDDVFSIVNGAGDPTNIGLSASWRGYWKLDGTSGETPTTGDDALDNAIDSSWPMKASVRDDVEGSLLVYDDAIPFVSNATIGQPIVYPGGKFVAVPLKAEDTGEALNVVMVNDSAMPTYSVDGGDPVAFDRAIGTSLHEAVGYFIDGDPIPPGASVTFSADSGFVLTSSGVTPSFSDVACLNCSGRPIHQGETPMPGVGLNITTPFDIYWAYYQGRADMQFRCMIDPTGNVSDDGTYAGTNHFLLVQPAFNNSFDKTSTPLLPGAYAVVYDDLTDTKTKEISIESLYPGHVYEDEDYRNDPADGIGKARLFRTQILTYDGYTLAAACDADDTTLTLNKVDDLVAAGVIGPKMWLKIEDEVLNVLTVNTGAKQVTVERGAGGTTAAAHESGTSATSAYWTATDLYIKFAGPDGQNCYANLAIYGPGDFDLPETPGPITVDRSYEARRRPARSIREAVVPGIATVRHMDAIGTFHPAAEVEDCSSDDDLYSLYAYHRTIEFKIAKVRPYWVADSPYTISHMEGETWTATLSEAIATAPDAGTTETITISDAVEQNIIIGCRIKVDDEWMRVMGVDGTDVQVKRGAMNTTPATHEAGTITVGWRHQTPSDESIQSNDRIRVELVTDRPHGVPWGIWATAPTSTNNSVLARIPFTLAADAAAGATSIAISIDDADDWQYITTNLFLVVDGESIKVTGAADPDTGVVPVQATKSAHSSGATGVGRSDGIFIATADDSSRMWTLAQGTLILFPTGPNTLMTAFSCSQLGGTPGICQGEQEWDTSEQVVNGTDKRLVSWSLPFSTCSIEQTARVAKLAPGCMVWTNIPAHASDDLCYDWANKLLANLPAGQHTVGLEYMNEIWNIGFNFLNDLNSIAKIKGYSYYYDWHILRRQRIYEIFKEVFDADGRGDEIKSIACFQSGGMGNYLQRCRDLGSIDHVIGAATYIQPAPIQENIDAYNASDDYQATDLSSFDLRYYEGSGSDIQRRLRQDKAAFDAHKAANPDKTFLFAAYEGGLQYALPVPPNGISDTTVYPAGKARCIDISMHPNYWNTQYDMPYVLREVGGYDVITYFNHAQPPAGLDQGAGSKFALWGLTYYNCQPAGKGDGSEGDYDNLDGIAQPGFANSKGPTDNYFATKASVRLGAVTQYAADYAASIEGEHDPLPRRIPIPFLRRRKARPASLYRIPMEHAVEPPEVVTRPRRLPTPVYFRKRGITPSLARVPIEHVPPPPPTPDPVPVIGRRVIVHRLSIS